MLDFGFYNMDCMEGMKQFPDKYFDLAIVDPPYGINIEKSGRLKRYNTSFVWDSEPPKVEYFNELFRVSKHAIIWGGNYFDLPPTRCFLIWDKKQPEKISFASCEMAWTNLDGVAKTFYYSPFADKDIRIHTTQKPIALYVWILNKYANKDDIILDTHVGSASSLIACYRTGHKFVGFELDEYYYKEAKNRLDTEMSRRKLF